MHPFFWNFDLKLSQEKTFEQVQLPREARRGVGHRLRRHEVPALRLRGGDGARHPFGMLGSVRRGVPGG